MVRVRLNLRLLTLFAAAVALGSCGGGESTGPGQSVATGDLSLTINGLPANTPAQVTVTGPDGFSTSVTATSTVSGLTPGEYTVSGESVTAGGDRYDPFPASQTISVASGAGAAGIITYGLATGRLTVTISGLPNGTPADVTVTGPGGYTNSLTATETLASLEPGLYVVNAAAVTAGGDTYSVTPQSDSVAVGTGITPANAALVYFRTTATLDISISGLPQGTAADVDVTGPGGYSQSLTASQVLTQLVPGTYTVTASAVTSGAVIYTPQPTTRNVALAAGEDGAASVAYAPPGGITLNFSIPTLYLVQSIQRPNGSIPLVNDRDAYLRVFATANQANASSPDVRIRLYQGGSVVLDDTVSAGQVGVPTTVQEGSLAASWDLLIPGNLIQPGLEVLAEVNPGGQAAEADPNDNTWPANGQPGALDVRTLPTLDITFIPVHQSDGSNGNITAGNSGQYIDEIARMWPVNTISTSVGATYNFTGPVLQSDDGNGSWGMLLSEIHALRASLPGTAYLYGVVHTNYGSGIAGLGYVPSSPSSTAKTAIGWDHLPTGSDVFAHEIGHNFGRSHAPCGGVASPDPNFPHAGGSIGYYGMDVAALSLKSPATYIDLMGYCNPTWVSDYNYMAVMNYRLASPLGAPGASVASAGLLVWGRITDDTVVLEPAFRVNAPAQLPGGSGPYRIEGYAADGSLSFSYAFQAVEVPDLPGGPQHHFAFVIPAGSEVSSVKLVTPQGTRTRRSATPIGAAQQAPANPVTAQRVGAGLVKLDWDASSEPMVVVRNDQGRIISFARGGSATFLEPPGNKLDLQFSDGVKVRNAKLTIR